MVAALIMPRSATTQARSTPKRLRSRSITGSRVVTSAVLPGQQEGGDRPVLLIQHDAEHDLVELRAEVLGMPGWPSVAPPSPSKYSEVVSKKATEIAPNSDLRCSYNAASMASVQWRAWPLSSPSIASPSQAMAL